MDHTMEVDLPAINWKIAYFTERDRWFRESVTDTVRLQSY